MSDWLRPVFGRRVQASSSSDRPSSVSVDESAGSEDGIVPAGTPRLRPTSRVSSYLGIRPSTPPIPQTSTPDTVYSSRDPESVYHEPSPDQMAEMLKVVMMNQSIGTAVPVEYNSTISHVLEAYQEMRMELRRREETIEELKESHTKDIKDFEALATQWETKEQNYKTEMKKLEVLLSKTDGGLEKVSLARSKSTVHGSQKVGESIKRDIGTIKARHAARSSKEHSDKDGEEPIDASTSYRYRADRFFKTRIQTDPQISQKAGRSENRDTRKLHSRASTSSLSLNEAPTKIGEAASYFEAANQDLVTLAQAQLKALERQRAHEEFGIDLGSSSSESESSTNTHQETFSPVALPRGLGIGYQNPQLDALKRTVSKKPSNLSLNNSCTSEYDMLSKDSPQQMGFSFRPGDDAEALAQRTRTGQTPRRPASTNPRAQSSSEAAALLQQQKSEPSSHLTAPKEEPRRPTLPSARPSSSRHRSVQDFEGFKRDESNSSLVTALRDNSGRSSVSGSQNSIQTRRKLSRSSGNSEAITAAALALSSATTAKKSSAQRKSGSDSTDGASQAGSSKMSRASK
ncbi:uncharacterized protein RSE6_13876 [Rhynchosporium secalis]|uniref:Uncharacterized protein n=1 Tax=Rhynchosporium secalis TaxID=38038 RepID=A0A1E1MU02_RHYSE|nr:uncharacterized protein RSE6_13876 [Rhynchosporium secalis]